MTAGTIGLINVLVGFCQRTQTGARVEPTYKNASAAALLSGIHWK